MAGPALLSSHAHCVSEHDVHHQGWTCPFERSTVNSNLIIEPVRGLIKYNRVVGYEALRAPASHIVQEGHHQKTRPDQKTPQQIVRKAEKIRLSSMHYGPWHLLHPKSKIYCNPTCPFHTQHCHPQCCKRFQCIRAQNESMKWSKISIFPLDTLSIINIVSIRNYFSILLCSTSL